MTMSSFDFGSLIAFHIADPDVLRFRYSAVVGLKRQISPSSSAAQHQDCVNKAALKFLIY